MVPNEGRDMHSVFRRSLGLLGLALALFGGAGTLRLQDRPADGSDLPQNPRIKELPRDVILVKGAWSSASDSTTPVPESGTLANSTYHNTYFGLSYALAPGWTQKYSGPPPSDSGYYVLAQLSPADKSKEPIQGSILIAAQDLFFTLAPAQNALQLIKYSQERLQPDYKVEHPVTLVSIANHSFVRFDYFSPIAQLHWYVLATQIRCHVVQFVFTGRDAGLLESLIREMQPMKLSAEADPMSGTGGGDVPVCRKDYARAENIIQKVEPAFAEQRFNAIPVRIVIDQQGHVKHIHFLSAFPDQAKSITDALSQWRFKPYVLDGRPVEVETGIMFGRVPPAATPLGTDPLSPSK
jgi:hypothetical protein